MINGIEVAKGIEWKKEAHNQDSYLDISVSKSKGYEKIPGKKGSTNTESVTEEKTKYISLRINMNGLNSTLKEGQDEARNKIQL